MDRLHLIRVFVAVVDANGLAGAARKLKVSPSVVTRAINELESLVDASAHSPALSPGHPFTDLQQAYWSSTTSAFETDWAYVLYMHKGAVGVGYKKNRDFALWPVISVQRAEGS
mgnify:CR=1 FL=1